MYDFGFYPNPLSSKLRSAELLRTIRAHTKSLALASVIEMSTPDSRLHQQIPQQVCNGNGLGLC
jgi:hypothetical protein